MITTPRPRRKHGRSPTVKPARSLLFFGCSGTTKGQTPRGVFHGGGLRVSGWDLQVGIELLGAMVSGMRNQHFLTKRKSGAQAFVHCVPITLPGPFFKQSLTGAGRYLTCMDKHPMPASLCDSVHRQRSAHSSAKLAAVRCRTPFPILTLECRHLDPCLEKLRELCI